MGRFISWLSIHKYQFLTALLVAYGTISLIAALLACGYLLDSFPRTIDEFGKLRLEGLNKVLSLDSAVWCPGIYVVAWVVILDQSSLHKNFYLFGSLFALIPFVAIDNIRYLQEANPPFILDFVDIIINGVLVFFLWRLPLCWPTVISNTEHWTRPLRSIPLFRSYIEGAAENSSVIIYVTLFANAHKILRLFGNHVVIDNDLFDFFGQSVIAFHLLIFVALTYAASSPRDRRRIIWALSAVSVFVLYAMGGLLIEVMAENNIIVSGKNGFIVANEWICYSVITAILLIGSLFSELSGHTYTVQASWAFFLTYLIMMLLIEIYVHIGFDFTPFAHFVPDGTGPLALLISVPLAFFVMRLVERMAEPILSSLKNDKEESSSEPPRSV